MVCSLVGVLALSSVWGLLVSTSFMVLETLNCWFGLLVVDVVYTTMSLSIFCVLMGIFLMVIKFSGVYMMSDKGSYAFLYVVSMFVLGMVVFVLFSDVYSVLVGWEILGVVSFMLIFYYGSVSAKVSSLFTICMNRVGDLSLIVFCCFWVVGGFVNEWGFWMFVGVIMCLLTKSAQFPFSVWLPMAMSAPTPVSSLVHSSTLVTAGLILAVVFSFWVEGYFFSACMMFGVFTLALAGVSSLVEADFKKIVALSTLFHLGFMSILLGLNCSDVSVAHLIFHGGFKSLLFVSVGMVILLFSHEQDIRRISGPTGMVFYLVVMVFSVFSLVGVPYFSGAMAKEVALSAFEMGVYSVCLYALFLVSLSCSLTYSLRMVLNPLSVLISTLSGLGACPSMVWAFVSMGVFSMVGWGVLAWVAFFTAVSELSISTLVVYYLVALGVYTSSGWVVKNAGLIKLSVLWSEVVNIVVSGVAVLGTQVEMYVNTSVLTVLPIYSMKMGSLALKWYGVVLVSWVVMVMLISGFTCY
uniref:NADH:ubiquinone reductase (H(+)-translocating) n=1 Tax=Hebesoma violentum TaxID=1410563 RepID=A0A0C4JX24_9BILA|nr:NADH dehydrogenase subunit 5 [Hebesoma violentum]